MDKLKDGRSIPPSILRSAHNTKRIYSMDMDTLVGHIFDFEVALVNAHMEPEHSNYLKYRRGYLLKCEEIWRKQQ